MRSVAEIERAAGITWSPDERATVAGWNVVSSGGFTRRTNCAIPTAGAATDIEARAAVETWLGERGARLVVRVTPLADGGLIHAVSGSWGLDRADETVVMTKRLSAASPGGSPVVDPADQEFAAELLSLNDRPAEAITAWTRMVRRLGGDATGIWVKGKAAGFVAVAGDMAAVYSVAVDPAHRRNGLATDVMATAEAWAAGKGACDVFLQVRQDNEPARHMYHGLDYREQYRYHYLEPTAARE